MSAEYDDLLKKLKDPTFRAAAEKAGFKVSDPGDELDIPEISEDSATDMTALVKEFNRVIKTLATSLHGKTKQVRTEVSQELTQKEEARRVADFRKAHKHFDNPEVLKIMDPLYQTNGDLDKAYETATKSLGLLEEPTKKVTEKAKEEKPVAKKEVVSAQRDTATVDDGDLEKAKPKTLREAAKNNLSTIMSNMGIDSVEEDDES